MSFMSRNVDDDVITIQAIQVPDSKPVAGRVKFCLTFEFD